MWQEFRAFVYTQVKPVANMLLVWDPHNLLLRFPTKSNKIMRKKKRKIKSVSCWTSAIENSGKKTYRIVQNIVKTQLPRCGYIAFVQLFNHIPISRPSSCWSILFVWLQNTYVKMKSWGKSLIRSIGISVFTSSPAPQKPHCHCLQRSLFNLILIFGHESEMK